LDFAAASATEQDALAAMPCLVMRAAVDVNDGQ
jgi:hypothetical protein